MANEYLDSLISRYPALELSIRRLHKADLEFRSICEELEMADNARERWKAKGMSERADEYQRIFDRLQDEFLDYLSRKTRSLFVQELKQGVGNNDRNT